jgi:hypothetical protein
MRIAISIGGVRLQADLRPTVCSWTEGDAMALPYGRTPISTDERPRLASRWKLAAVKAGQKVTVQRA